MTRFLQRMTIVMLTLVAGRFAFEAMRPHRPLDAATTVAWLTWHRNPSPQTESEWRAALSAQKERDRLLRLEYAAVAVVVGGVVVWLLLHKPSHLRRVLPSDGPKQQAPE